MNKPALYKTIFVFLVFLTYFWLAIHYPITLIAIPAGVMALLFYAVYQVFSDMNK